MIRGVEYLRIQNSIAGEERKQHEVTKYVSVAEMVAIEKEADASGLSYAQMMENAGAGLANVVAREYAAYSERGVLGWVGSGNNGGDTLVALAHLAQRGWRATAYLIRQRAQDDPLVTRFQDAGGKVFTH